VCGRSVQYGVRGVVSCSGLSPIKVRDVRAAVGVVCVCVCGE